MNIAAAAELLGVPEREILGVDDSPAGPVIRTSGVAYVVVPDDQPDGAGKTGLMYLAAPVERYTDSFPVYTAPVDLTPPADPADPVRDTGMSEKDALLADARDLGIEVGKRWGVDRIREAVNTERDALAAAAAEERAALEARAVELGLDLPDDATDEDYAVAIAAAEAAATS